MAGIPGIPQNFTVQTANQQNLVSWSLSPGATSYVVQRSLDNVTYTTIATVSGSPLATSYLDTAVVLATQYWYTVAAVNISGSSSPTKSFKSVDLPFPFFPITHILSFIPTSMVKSLMSVLSLV